MVPVHSAEHRRPFGTGHPRSRDGPMRRRTVEKNQQGSDGRAMTGGRGCRGGGSPANCLPVRKRWPRCRMRRASPDAVGRFPNFRFPFFERQKIMAKATARVRRPSRNNLGNRRLPQKKKRKYTLKTVDPWPDPSASQRETSASTKAERGAIRGEHGNMQQLSRGTFTSSSKRVYAIDLKHEEGPRNTWTRILRLPRRRNSPGYTTPAGQRCGRHLLPGVRRFRGSGYKTRSAWRARQLRRKGWKPSGANGKEPS